MNRLLFPLTLFVTIGCGLLAGVFFAFSAFVMEALAHLPPAQGIAAMQSINVAAINPLFMGALFVTALLCLPIALSALATRHEPGAVYLLAGSALYLVGAILVTIAFNVPLNDALAATNPVRGADANLWSGYVASWTAWNHVRTAAALAAMASFVLALRKHPRRADGKDRVRSRSMELTPRGQGVV